LQRLERQEAFDKRLNGQTAQARIDYQHSREIALEKATQATTDEEKKEYLLVAAKCQHWIGLCSQEDKTIEDPKQRDYQLSAYQLQVAANEYQKLNQPVWVMHALLDKVKHIKHNTQLAIMQKL